jgi:hypothetical protein
MTTSRSFLFGTVSFLYPFQTRVRNNQCFSELLCTGQYKYGVGTGPSEVGSCHHSRSRSSAAEGGRVSIPGEELGMNRIRSRGQPARGDPPAGVLGEVLTSPHCKKRNVLEALHKVSELDRSCGTKQAVERSGLLWFRLWTVADCCSPDCEQLADCCGSDCGELADCCGSDCGQLRTAVVQTVNSWRTAVVQTVDSWRTAVVQTVNSWRTVEIAVPYSAGISGLTEGLLASLEGLAPWS